MRVGSVAEIAVQFCRRRHVGLILRWLDIAPTFVTCVKESPVLDDRAAHTGPKLILPQYRRTVRRNGLGHRILRKIREGITGVEGIVAHKFPCRTMELVSAGF